MVYDAKTINRDREPSMYFKSPWNKNNNASLAYRNEYMFSVYSQIHATTSFILSQVFLFFYIESAQITRAALIIDYLC